MYDFGINSMIEWSADIGHHFRVSSCEEGAICENDTYTLTKNDAETNELIRCYTHTRNLTP